MKKIGIVAEFNPFHNGHKYIIEQAKIKLQADYVIVAMSGDFVQRGTPAFMDKYDRTRIALENGADLVLMMPVGISTSSAEGFATGAVKMLHEAGVDTLCFGVEGKVDILGSIKKIARLLALESEEYKLALSEELKKGNSFPMARANALTKTAGLSEEELGILESPNNLLAIEYVKAIIKLDYAMDTVAVERVDKGYHSKESDGKYASASMIRDGLMNAKSCEQKYQIARLLPGYEIERFVFDYNTKLNDFLLYALLNLKQSDDVGGNAISDILDLTPDLCDRLLKLLPEYKDFHQFASLVKNKSITYTRVCRVLIHIMLNISSRDAEVNYLRVLGMRDKGGSLLGEISNNSKLPVVTQLAEYRELISKDLHAGRVYGTLIGCEVNELSRRLIVV